MPTVKDNLDGPVDPYKCFRVNSSIALPKSIMRLNDLAKRHQLIKSMTNIIYQVIH